jgi:hypothetical protein
MKLKVLTKSGAEYLIEYDGGLIQWWHRGEYRGRCWGLKLMDPDAVSIYADNDTLWGYIYDLPWAHQPEVGKRLYIAGKRDWRISTPVVSIERVDGWNVQDH